MDRTVHRAVLGRIRDGRPTVARRYLVRDPVVASLGSGRSRGDGGQSQQHARDAARSRSVSAATSPCARWASARPGVDPRSPPVSRGKAAPRMAHHHDGHLTPSSLRPGSPERCRWERLPQMVPLARKTALHFPNWTRFKPSMRPVRSSRSPGFGPQSGSQNRDCRHDRRRASHLLRSSLRSP